MTFVLSPSKLPPTPHQVWKMFFLKTKTLFKREINSSAKFYESDSCFFFNLIFTVFYFCVPSHYEQQIE